MFTIGLGELLLVFVIAVVLIGPKQLPAVLTSYRRIMQRFTKLKATLTRELDLPDEKNHHE